jgi:hypothetical protein
LLVCLGLLLLVPACTAPRPGTRLERRGDEIVIAGQLFHTNTPVVLWTDPGGYDAYRVEKRFAPYDESTWDAMTTANKAPDSPNRYNLRFAKSLHADDLERLRGGGWSLQDAQDRIDQFVIHYDACGTSRTCFRVLHDQRNLSVHFMLDIDGTIYQTLDVKERAWHATTSNDRSVGIEIANIGAYTFKEKDPFDQWYQREPAPARRGTVGHVRTRLTIPPRLGDGGVRTPNFVGYTDRPEQIVGEVQGRTLRQYDLTPQQYAALEKLTATLCTALPKIRCDYPREADGKLITGKLPDDQLATYTGLLGHYHIQANKIDPGPAFQWERVIRNSRAQMRSR